MIVLSDHLVQTIGMNILRVILYDRLLVLHVNQITFTSSFMLKCMSFDQQFKNNVFVEE